MPVDSKISLTQQWLEDSDFNKVPASEPGVISNEFYPLVSVLMITLNHGSYIAEAIETILKQQCDFPFELIIGEDCSLDNTRAICEAYQLRNPDVVRLVYSERNVGMHRNLARIWHRARGKYIALCEGDDYWSDPRKLAKQVAFLESRSNFVLCGTYTQKIRKQGNGVWEKTEIIGPDEIKECYGIEDLIPRYSFHTSSVLIRKENICFPRWFWDMYCADRPLYLLCAEHGKVGFIPEITSVYRQHDGGIWSHLDLNAKAKNSTELFVSLDKHFNYCYSSLIKRTLSDIMWSYMSEAIDKNDLLTAAALFWRSIGRHAASFARQPKIVIVAFLRIYSPRLYQQLKTLAR